MKRVLISIACMLMVVGCSSAPKEEEKQKVEVPETVTSLSIMGKETIMIDIGEYVIRDNDYGYELEVGKDEKVVIGWGMEDLATEYGYSIEDARKDEISAVNTMKVQIVNELLSKMITVENIELKESKIGGNMKYLSGTVKTTDKTYNIQVCSKLVGSYPVYFASVDLSEGSTNEKKLQGILENVSKTYEKISK